MFAAAGDNLTIVNYLVDAGADLKAFAVAGDTAVHTALFTCDLAQLGNITVEDVRCFILF